MAEVPDLVVGLDSVNLEPEFEAQEEEQIKNLFAGNPGVVVSSLPEQSKVPGQSLGSLDSKGDPDYTVNEEIKTSEYTAESTADSGSTGSSGETTSKAPPKPVPPAQASTSANPVQTPRTRV